MACAAAASLRALFEAFYQLVRKATKAGARLQRTPVATDKTRANAAMLGFIETESMRGRESGIRCKVLRIAIAANAKPSRPPAVLRRSPSTRDSRMMRLALAPIATRTAYSRR